MVNKYDPGLFVAAIESRINNSRVPQCRYCGGNKFTTTDSMASVLIGKDLNAISIGPSIPSGMIVCEKCGHIEFFALGALGLLKKEDGDTDGKEENRK